ncbi:MAG: PD-(D/E)XK nuclease family protein [archaeon]|nr:PD-(D/E)XK nuclease family protein [archaeon]
MRKAKTIDEIYEEVRDYDYVITCDAPLATALNNMINRCKLDGFAFTPQTIAGMVQTVVLDGKVLTELELIDRLERDTGFDFRYIHSEVQNIKDIRRYTADVEKYLYTRKSRELFQHFRELPTSTKVMDIYNPVLYRSFLLGKRVAVVGIELFNDLDKHFLPPDFDEIDAFTDEDYEIPVIHAIGNDRQTAGSIVDRSEPETRNDTAIVLDAGGSIADAVRAALYRKHIPFKNDLDMKDLAQIRDYLLFITLALDYRTLRVADVRELFSTYQAGHNTNRHGELRPEMDRYLLCRAPLEEPVDPVTRRLMDTMEHIREVDFAYACEALFQDAPIKASVEILLENMHLRSEKITTRLVSRLTYAVNNISDLKHNEQVPEDERKGVLIADCRNSVYVDRPFVIYVGLDESWEQSANGKDYVDKQRLDEDNAFRLGILLQQGTSRLYAVKPVTKGKETAPCATFQTMYQMAGRPRAVSSFRDICTEYVTGSWFRVEPREPPMRGSAGDFTSDRGWRFSKSAYNAYSDCPIKFLFSKLLPGEDNEYTVFGNCLHEFAEFYYCYPDIVRQRGLDHYVSALEGMYAGMSNECQRELDTSRFRVYINNIVRYVDLIRPDIVPLKDDLSARKYPNIFMQEEGLSMCSSLTESEMSTDGPLYAKFDVCHENSIVDYKTGKAKEPAEILKGFTRRGKGLSEFQALVYLSVLGANRSGDCSFDLLFIGDNDISSVSEDFDIRRNVRTVVLRHEGLDVLAFGENGVLRSSIQGVQKYADLLARWDEVSPLLMDIFHTGPFDSPSNVTMMMNALGLKNLKKNSEACAGLLKKAADCVKLPYLLDSDGRVVIPWDSMEAFVRQVAEDRRTAAEEMCIPMDQLRKGNMPCRKCSYFKACMKADLAEDLEEEDE